MLYTKETYNLEKSLSNWCRTGEQVSLKASREDGLIQYRRLFRNNIHNTLVQAFPIAYEVLSEDEWTELVDMFFANKDVKDGRLWLMPRDFYEFVREEGFVEKYNKPWLNDLLLFEWVEIEVHTMADVPKEPCLKKGDLMDDVIEINPEFRLVQLEYPVHLYAVEKAVDKKGIWFLLTYRDPESFLVRFSNLHPLAAVIFEKIRIEQKTLNQILIEFESTGQPLGNKQKEEIVTFVKLMFDEKVFTGFASYYHN